MKLSVQAFGILALAQAICAHARAGNYSNSPPRIGSALLIASWCLTTPALAAPGPECHAHTPLAMLTSHPDNYHGKVLVLIAYVTIEFENMTACPAENETQMKNCLWINIDDGSYKTEQDYPRYEAMLQNWKRFDRQTVAIRATFDKSEKGHFSMWPGSLINVTEVSGNKDSWNFATNTAVPRNCLTGK